jgi:hypothetical protein
VLSVWRRMRTVKESTQSVVDAHFGLSCCLENFNPSGVRCVVIVIYIIVFDER